MERIRRRARMLAVLVAVPLAAIPIAIWITTKIVVVDDPLAPADFIYVLNGRIPVRGGYATVVYARRLAPRVLVPVTRATFVARDGRPGIALSDSLAAYIVAHGVPDSAVEVIPFPGGVVHTRDEGLALRHYLQRNPVRRVIVVTADYHTGRARRTLRQELEGLDVELLMAAAPADDGTAPGSWWRSVDGIDRYLTEFAHQLAAIVQHATRTGQAARPYP